MYRFICLLGIFLNLQAAFAQTSEDDRKNTFFINSGLNSPLSNPFASSGDNDPTNGKGYKRAGVHFSISQSLNYKNKGIINTFFLSSNGYDSQKQMKDDKTITQIINGTWETIGFLSGYYRNFVFKKKDFLSLDIKIQGGLIYGNYPVSYVNHDLGQGATNEVFYFDSWTSGVMALAGVGLKFKIPGGKDALRLGLEYTAGHINHVIDQSTLGYQYPSTTTTTGTAIIHSDYFGVNFTVGYVFHL